VEDIEILQDIDWDNLTFSLSPTRSMYIAEQRDNKAWERGKLVPFGNVSISPAAGVLNYGQGIFEGLKAFRTSRDRSVLFRPKNNAARAIESAKRLCIPPVPQEMFMEAILEVVRDNADYIPPLGKGSLYIRPVIWGTGAVLGVKPAQSYTFLVFVSPVGHYFKNSEKSLHLKITNKFHRAAPRGTGGFKAIGNYAASLLPQKLAKKAGFDEVIYLNAANENFVEEVGSANLFILKDQTLVTPALTGSILPGVTRDSVIQIAKKILRLEVQEREVSVDEVLDADEVFCSGTAVTVTSIGEITTDKTFRIISGGEIGPYTMRISEILSGIRNETVEDQFEWLFPVF
ncbi:uncharacterized protein METZ01_LOCUS62, partial [marine metagenome]